MGHFAALRQSFRQPLHPFRMPILSILLTIFYFIPTGGTPICAFNTGPNATGTSSRGSIVTYSSENTCARVEDAYDAAIQIGNRPLIGKPIYADENIASIVFFNFFGVSVTKHVNASTRMVLDSLRTMAIWGFSLGLGWEKFCYMQVIGLISLPYTCNSLIPPPARCMPTVDSTVSSTASDARLARGERAALEGEPIARTNDERVVSRKT